MKKGMVFFLALVLLISFGSAESNETETEECAANISVTFNQDIYYEGDFFNITVEVFDSQGNRIPNYPFYTSAYLYSEGVLDYDPSLETTNNEGYYEESGEVESNSDRGRILYRVYTEETDFCPEVEDSVEIEFIGEEETEESEPGNCTDSDGGRNHYEKGTTIGSNTEITDFCGIRTVPEYSEPIIVDSCEKIEWESGNQCVLYEGACGEPPEFDESHAIRWEHDCPYGCEDGACIGEEIIINPNEEGGPIDISEEGVFYFCDGCELFLPESEIKCYPYGYRKEGRYCFDEDNEFVNQKEAGASCDNNFECESNVCVTGECVGEGLIKKIIAWFKRLFGIEPPRPPGPYMCSELLIEEDIGDCKYIQSIYDSDESQMPVYSRDGDQISEVTCCVVEYEGQGGQEQRAIVCPYNNRKDLKNSISWFIKQEGFVPEEYKDQKVCLGGEIIIIWTHNKYLLAVGGDPPFSENITDVYLDKYSSDLEDIELPEVEDGEARFLARNTIVSDCSEIIDSDARDECYARIKTLADCEELTDINEKEDCYLEVAVISTINISICERITNDNLRESCYEGIGQRTKDLSVCEKILDSSRKQSCYINVAMQIEDVSVCEEIVEDVYRDRCYFGIAVGTDNSELCEKITDTRRKENCYERF